MLFKRQKRQEDHLSLDPRRQHQLADLSGKQDVSVVNSDHVPTSPSSPSLHRQYRLKEKLYAGNQTDVYRAMVDSDRERSNDKSFSHDTIVLNNVVRHSASNHPDPLLHHKQKSVIVKLSCKEFPSTRSTNRLRRDYSIVRTIHASIEELQKRRKEQREGGETQHHSECLETTQTFCGDTIIRYYDLVKHGYGLAIVMEDISEESSHVDGLWRSFIPKGGISIKDFFTLALQLVEGLGAIHQVGFIHNAIRPHNILIDWKRLVVRIIDFGSASELQREFPSASILNQIELKQLRYVSPEQTGRMNRSVTLTSDIYSLGVVFYELLGGVMPFEDTHDVVKLVYAIIANKPVHLSDARSDIPIGLADIIMHMMEKDLDERYQSMYGVKMDLLKCFNLFAQDMLTRETMITIGEHDVHTTFSIKQKLYGRSEEVKKLVNGYKRVQRGDVGSQLILVRGDSGTGKSSLINELQKVMIEPQSGFFVTGKFDQIKRAMMKPYASFIEAFQQLILMILSDIDYWRDRIVHALGLRVQVIIDVIPEVEILTGPQPPVEVLPPTENQNRFYQVLLDFIRVFTQEEHSLVICFDDLQWADLNSIKLIEMLISDANTKYLMIIGTYRTSQCSDALTSMIQNLKIKHSDQLEEIELVPLCIENVTEMLNDSLSSNKTAVRKLAEIAHTKTGGNPLFLKSYLMNLAHEGLIRFDNATISWIWNVEEIISTRITDNVLDMTIERIQKLPTETQNLLSIASAIGDKFDVSLLSLLSGAKRDSIINILWPALKEGLIVQRSGEDCESITREIKQWSYPRENDDSPLAPNTQSEISFMYTHDKIQQAAYERLGVLERQNIHLTIGRTLLSRHDKLTSEESFQIIAHFKNAESFLSDDEEKIRVARICLDTGTRAKMSTAYRLAVTYLKFGVSLLPKDCWTSHYTLTLKLYLEQTQVYFLTSKVDKAEKLYSFLLTKARDDLDKYRIHMTMINHYEVQQKYQDAIILILECLSMFGIHILKERGAIEEMLRNELTAIQVNLKGKIIEDLLDSPQIKDEKDLVIMQLFHALWIPAYAGSDAPLAQLSSALSTNYSIQHGNCEMSSIGFMQYSFVSGELTGDYLSAWRFGKVALGLADKYDNVLIREKCYLLFGAGTNNWVQRISFSLYYLNRGFELALEVGDVGFSCYSAQHFISDIFYANENFTAVRAIYKERGGYIKETNDFIFTFLQCSMLAFRYLAGLEHDEIFEFDEEEFLKSEFALAPIMMASYSLASLQRAMYKNDHNTQLLPLAENVYEHSPRFLFGTFRVSLCYFYSSIAFLAECRDENQSNSEKKEELLGKVDQSIEKFTLWTSNCEANFEHKLFILKAERARTLNQFEEAVRFYNEAIQSAHKHDFPLYEALANELAGRFWIESGLSTYATQHLKSACYLYHSIGAYQKVLQMHKAYPELDAHQNKQDENSLDTDCGIEEQFLGSKCEASNIDDISVYKGLQALIDSDIRLEELLNRMMNIIIENTGASRAVFLLAEQENKLLVVSEGKLDQEIDSMRAIPLESYQNCPKMILYYVEKSHETVIIDNCRDAHPFSGDCYFNSNHPKSVMVFPIIRQDQFKGILYLESNTITNAFSLQRLKVLIPLAVQMTVLLENQKFAAVLMSEKNYRTIAAELKARKQRLEEFIDVLCHELRNPLHGIFGSTEILNEALPKLCMEARVDNQTAVSVKDSIEAITVSAYHLKDIVDCVLNISMLENQTVQLKKIIFDPAETIQNILQIFKGQITNKAITMLTKLEKTELVEGDPYRFKEIIINLVSNAIKFTPQGSVTVTCTCEPTNDPDSINVVVSVIDTGIGMTSVEQHKLFKPFSQASKETFETYGGSGLGLKITKDLVELMGGTIGLTSQKDIGSAFRFNVILKKPSVEAEKEYRQHMKDHYYYESNTNDTNTDSKKTKFILVAEDNAINQKLLTRLLNSEGYQYMVANNGLEAYNTYCNHHSDILVILMDIEMPVCNGIESSRRIRQFEKENSLTPIPIVGVSANSRSEYIDKIIQTQELSDYITKPYMKLDLLNCIDRWSRVNK